MLRPSRPVALSFLVLTFATALSASEFAVSEPLTPSRQEAPLLAAAAGANFAVWGELRSHPFVEEIYATRLAPNGVPLDGSGIPVAVETSGLSLRSLPRIAANGGSRVAIVWREIRDGRGTLHARVLDSDGRVMDPIVIGDAPAFDYPTFDVTFAPGGFTVFWFHEGSIMARRLNDDGMLLDPAPVPVAHVGTAGEVVAKYSGTRHVLVFNAIGASNDRDLFALAVTPLLTLERQLSINEEAGDATRLALTASPLSDLLLTWVTTTPGIFPSPAKSSVLAARLWGDGTKNDTSPIVLSTPTPDVDLRPAVTWLLPGFRVVWHEVTRTRSRFFSATVPGAGSATPAAEVASSSSGLHIGGLMTDELLRVFVGYRRPSHDPRGAGELRGYVRPLPPFSRKRSSRR